MSTLHLEDDSLTFFFFWTYAFSTGFKYFLPLHYSEAVGSYAENQRITAVRRVYQRGCVNPMINIEQLWRDYSKYEEVSGSYWSRLDRDGLWAVLKCLCV